MIREGEGNQGEQGQGGPELTEGMIQIPEGDQGEGDMIQAGVIQGLSIIFW